MIVHLPLMPILEYIQTRDVIWSYMKWEYQGWRLKNTLRVYWGSLKYWKGECGRKNKKDNHTNYTDWLLNYYIVACKISSYVPTVCLRTDNAHNNGSKSPKFPFFSVMRLRKVCINCWQGPSDFKVYSSYTLDDIVRTYEYLLRVTKYLNFM